MSHLNFWRSSHCIKWLFDEDDVLQKERSLATKWNIRHDEYNKLFSYFTEFIFLLCHECDYDYHIAGIASILFRRIFQTNGNNKRKFTFNDDPRLIAVVCIFITAKSKDCNIKWVKSFLYKIKQMDPHFLYNEEDIIESELLCLNILSLDLNIFLPFEACSDLLMLCNRLDILCFVWKLLLKGFKTNIYLLFPPYLIAIASVYIISNNKEYNFDFETFLNKIHVPFENIKEVTKHIIIKCFSNKTSNESSDNTNNNHNNGNNNNNVPIKSLKQIHLYYAMKKEAK